MTIHYSESLQAVDDPPVKRVTLRRIDPSMSFVAIDDALDKIERGKLVVVVDSENRQNEGDLMIAAQFATPEIVNFMTKFGRGLVCLCLTAERCDELNLHRMTYRDDRPFDTAFTISIEARTGVSTGVSAHDRSRTIQVAIDPSKGRDDLVKPGHMFPLRARPGGVLERAGHTEAAVDLARLAGLNPAGVICQVMSPDGTMARIPELVALCREQNVSLVSIADLIEYRLQHEASSV